MALAGGERAPRRIGKDEHEQRKKVLTQAHPAKVARTTNAIVCKYGSLFFTSNEAGDVPITPEEHGLGLYLADCRYLDGYELKVEGLTATALSSASAQGYETLHHLSTPDVRGKLPKDGIGIVRHRVARDDALYEVTTFHNYAREKVSFRVRLSFRSSFKDLFNIRGFVEDHGQTRRAERRGDSVVLRYDGLDKKRRTTTIGFSPKPKRLATDHAEFDLALKAGEERTVAVTITPHVQDGPISKRSDPAAEPRFHADDLGSVLEKDQREWVAAFASVRSSDELLDRVMERALRDLRILRAERDGLHFVAAGVPWFATLFGRDSCIVGLQTLPFGPSLAAETLKLLARFQSTKVDEYRDAEPGKMLHELRTGELATAGLIPQSPAYYGTVDATLLWVILLGQYLNWTGDSDLARDLRPNLEAAVEWTERWGDHDGDGYVDYTGRFKGGLVNQGWKDSGTSIVNADGSLPTPPIALCEVQGYLYRAWRTAARVFASFGERARADDLMRKAGDLRERFERDYWSERLGCYVLALQKGKRPCEVVASNAGQVLWGGIASPEHAARTAERLLAPDMFSGWGIRTLSKSAVVFNPLSYHLGSVWPHDNSLIVGGLRRYGHDDAAQRVFSALYAAAASFRDQRVPELYCGYDRDPAEASPVGYPVACSPQAWAAGALPYALWQILGLRARAADGKLIVDRPRLPDQVQWLEIHGLSLGDHSVDLRFERGDSGRVEVRTIGGGEKLTIERSP
ncbi:MAG: amylo-alpha-1,6-glucosidase [Chloroflexota bacterium]|nr:amylo-alpha-1,6-glucosidase [Chloroflexota bacterium]MDE3193290.1 amylo-alpha-1,6-glucosidase [Chloroflexota bacterium]